MNNAVNDTGYSAAHWVLGRGMKLPYDMLSSAARLSLQSRHASDNSFARRVAMMAASQRSIISLRYSRALSRALVARSRGSHATPISDRVNIGDQLFYWRGTCATPKSAWAGRWHGPAVAIGFEGGNNVWVAHRGATIKCS